MASGIFAILDDIAALMDDVAAASKIATQKTAGILGDDLAVNAEKATGFLSSREIPVLWEITKGSFINKLIIIPIALLLNVFFPAAIKGALILGGFYLAYEGVEKIITYFFHSSTKKITEISSTLYDKEEAEKTKIKAAIITDFILSVEIIIIALGTVIEKPFATQIVTIFIVAFIATIGVYGIVALIVRMDDVGYKLIKRSKNKGFLTKLGVLLVNLLPLIIKFLSIVGTIALIFVSGGIFVHNIDYVHHLMPHLPALTKEALFGLIAGIIVFVVVLIFKKLISTFKIKV